MRIEVPHKTTRANARKQVDEKVGALLSRFGGQADDIEYSWSGDTLNFKGRARGFTVEGSLEVTDSSVILESKLPFMAKPFEPRIAEAVRKEAEAMFRA